MSTLPQSTIIPPSNSQIEAVIQMATSSADSRSTARDTRTQLFVGNLPYRVRWQDLKDLFRKSGTVLRADVSLGPDNRSRGYGTVLLATPEDAARAVDMFNGYNWQTRTLEVRPDRIPPDFDSLNHVPTTNSNPNSLPSSSAAAAFPLPTHPYSHSPVDQSTATVEDSEAQKTFRDDRSRSGSTTASRSLFVGNLPFHCQWQDLKDLFRQAGTIVRADIATGPDGRSRGFGTVYFSNDADAERALNIFNGYEYNGRTLKVHYDKYSQQGQPSQSPVPPSSLPSTSPPQLHIAHPNAPAHIPMPMPPPPPLAAFEPPAPGHQSPSLFSHLFGQTSPYDLFPPHIAAMAANATAQAYMKSPQLSPPADAPTIDPLAAVSISTASSILSSADSMQSSPSLKPKVSTTTIKVDTVLPKQSPPTHNPAHPGPIALPSPPINPFPHVSGPVSPPQGLPPITPSMPSFTFVPQNATPPLSAHFLSPGVGLSPFSPPGTMSPGAFYHPAPNQRHPLGQVWNVAPGAHLHSPPMGSPGSPGFYAAPAQPPAEVQGGVGLGMGDYFSVPPQPRPTEGYFPPVAALRGAGSELPGEISRDAEGPGRGGDRAVHRVGGPSSVHAAPEGASFELRRGGAAGGSSLGTSVDGGESAGDPGKEMALSFSALSLSSSVEEVCPPPVPHRTNSDGAKPAPPAEARLPVPWDVCEQPRQQNCATVAHETNGAFLPSERRASWTPEATRTEFRRGLPL